MRVGRAVMCCIAAVCAATLAAGCGRATPSDDETSPTSGGAVDDFETSPDPASTSPVTGLGPQSETSWPASGEMTDEARATVAAALDGYESAILVPPAGAWPEPTVVEVGVMTYMPDPGYATPSVTIRAEPRTGSPLLSVQNRPVSGELRCDDQSGIEYGETAVRSTDGCAASNGTIAFVTWNEADQRWLAESGSLSVDELVGELARWTVVSATDL